MAEHDADPTVQPEQEDAQASANDSDAGEEVREAQMSEVTDAPSGAGGGQIDILLDTSMSVTAQLGHVDMQVRDLLALGEGSVLRLDRKASEPIDLCLRGLRFARGQLVVVGDQLGVRITGIEQAQPA